MKDRVARRARARLDPQINLAHLEAGQFDAEIKVEALELLKLGAKPRLVPGGELAQPIVRNDEGPPPGFVQVAERDRRRLAEPQALGRKQPAMTRQHAALLIHQYRDVEAERRDAVGDAGDLPGGMNARISLIGRQRLDRQPADRNRVRLPLRFRDWDAASKAGRPCERAFGLRRRARRRPRRGGVSPRKARGKRALPPLQRARALGSPSWRLTFFARWNSMNSKAALRCQEQNENIQ